MEGGPARVERIEGRVTGGRSGQKIVLFAKSRVWWVQPLTQAPFTNIGPDSRWTNSTHLGTEYAALLVNPDYRPPQLLAALPKKGGNVIAVISAPGTAPPRETAPKTVRFSGYEWEIRQNPSDRGGTMKLFDANNVWTDEKGWLHLRIAKISGDWKCAEVALTRSLGYGSYSFVVHDVSNLEPAAVLSMLTWDDLAADQNHREVDIEISRWGDLASKNAQYVVQPYYVPANVARFSAPSGALTYSFRWEPGKVFFRTMRGASQIVAEHLFTSGVPSAGGESTRINLYSFDYAKSPFQHGAEVVFEKFEYLP